MKTASGINEDRLRIEAVAFTIEELDEFVMGIVENCPKITDTTVLAKEEDGLYFYKWMETELEHMDYASNRFDPFTRKSEEGRIEGWYAK